MLGGKEPDGKVFATVSLERLVPDDNFYKRLSSVLHMRFIYQECKKYYGTTGRPSLDPVVFFKIVLYGYFENIISDRELMRRIHDSLAARYFIGYDLDDDLPWHSTISRTRGLIGEEVFEKLFTQVVKMCVDAGLVDGDHQSVDSTLVKANASLDSLERKSPKLTIAEYISKTEPEHKDKKNEDTPDDKPKQDGQRRNDQYVSKTDPDSKIKQKPNALNNLYYTTHYVVDRRRVITDVMTGKADRNDMEYLMMSVNRAKERLEVFGLSITSVGADRGYFSGENLWALEQMNITPYIPSQKYANATGGYANEEFIYDESRNTYTCPEGKELRHSTTDIKKKTDIYLAKPLDCRSCPRGQKCTTSRTGRKIHRSFYRPEYERLQDRMKQAAGKEAMRLRKITTEPLFAEAKGNHGLRKFMTRGIDKARKNSYVIATVQNIKRLLKAMKWVNNGQKSLLSQFFVWLQNEYLEILLVLY